MEIPGRRWIGGFKGARVATVYFQEGPDGRGLLSIGWSGGGDISMDAEPGPQPNVRILKAVGTDKPCGTLTIEQTSENQISGSWSLDSGALGIFELVLARDSNEVQQVAAQTAQSLWDRARPIGAVTLDRADIVRLISEMESYVPEPRQTIIRATEYGQSIVQSAASYLGRTDYPEVVRSMVISTEEANKTSYHKVINLILDDDGSSRIVASSPDELWTAAAAQRLDEYLTQFSSRLTGWLRRRGLGINTVILIAILIWMPDRPLVERIIGFSLGVALIALIARSHKLLPYNRVYLNPQRQKQPFAKELPGAAMAAAAGTVAAMLSSVPAIVRALKDIWPTIINYFGIQ